MSQGVFSCMRKARDYPPGFERGPFQDLILAWVPGLNPGIISQLVLTLKMYFTKEREREEGAWLDALELLKENICGYMLLLNIQLINHLNDDFMLALTL